ncbi:hypothetical protein M409DRAFT_53219 [Zasmidium cellare ATCC 36951]|uniref:Uncharacterized protein n=1 Tax=Zasmidium cellare ATCC 36951 TaxID=1080233 RepID=A0A6A6CNE3_ZASCE|nr:uncharacterized protein M409DRAFT_53219 [Zasmidium cellare ATCC 36951]KAF2168561.1 hypothetical protein M409DRAFT_53219 [Zasmidium cellare ATCC 36951]
MEVLRFSWMDNARPMRPWGYFVRTEIIRSPFEDTPERRNTDRTLAERSDIECEADKKTIESSTTKEVTMPQTKSRRTQRTRTMVPHGPHNFYSSNQSEIQLQTTLASTGRDLPYWNPTYLALRGLARDGNTAKWIKNCHTTPLIRHSSRGGRSGDTTAAELTDESRILDGHLVCVLIVWVWDTSFSGPLQPLALSLAFRLLLGQMPPQGSGLTSSHPQVAIRLALFIWSAKAEKKVARFDFGLAAESGGPSCSPNRWLLVPIREQTHYEHQQTLPATFFPDSRFHGLAMEDEEEVQEGEEVPALAVNGGMEEATGGAAGLGEARGGRSLEHRVHLDGYQWQRTMGLKRRLERRKTAIPLRN